MNFNHIFSNFERIETNQQLHFWCYSFSFDHMLSHPIHLMQIHHLLDQANFTRTLDYLKSIEIELIESIREQHSNYSPFYCFSKSIRFDVLSTTTYSNLETDFGLLSSWARHKTFCFFYFLCDFVLLFSIHFTFTVI